MYLLAFLSFDIRMHHEREGEIEKFILRIAFGIMRLAVDYVATTKYRILY